MTGHYHRDPFTSVRPQLTVRGAERLLDAAEEVAREAGLELCIAVVDPAGHLLAFRRMDGAGIVTIDAAIGKARTAAYVQAPSSRFQEMVDGGRPSINALPHLVPIRGGVPVRDSAIGEGGRSPDPVLGAIGISGSTGENDEKVALKAAESFQTLLGRTEFHRPEA